MFGLVAIHHNSSLRLHFPGTLIDIEDYHIHSEVEGCFLSAESGTKAGIEKDHKQGFVASQLKICKWIGLDLFCLCKHIFQGDDVMY